MPQPCRRIWEILDRQLKHHHNTGLPQPTGLESDGKCWTEVQDMKAGFTQYAKVRAFATLSPPQLRARRSVAQLRSLSQNNYVSTNPERVF